MFDWSASHLVTENSATAFVFAFADAVHVFRGPFPLYNREQIERVSSDEWSRSLRIVPVTNDFGKSSHAHFAKFRPANNSGP